MSNPPAERLPVVLGEIARAVPGARVIGDVSTRVQHFHQDSRAVESGSLFAVRRGEKQDGRVFVPAAIAQGASAVLTDDEALAHSLAVPALLVPDARAAIGPAALAVYGRPFDKLEVVGVTGTNGKTTTARLLGAALSELGERPAVLGTLGCLFAGESLAGTHTTPEADALVRLAAELVARGASHLVMEVSSHALSLSRVDMLRFRAAGFTNLTQDHLDFHGSMQAYGEAKARLFVDETIAAKDAVINVKDPFGAQLAEHALGKVWRVSPMGEGASSIFGRDVRFDVQGMHVNVQVPGALWPMRVPMVGTHNLENLMVALGLCMALGADAQQAIDALGKAPSVPGRLERCNAEGDDVLVVVDYAHTPDALTRVLAALRPLSTGKLWCVFGCGGDRDPTKRAPMGEAAARGADKLIVTNDNPRTEQPEAIAASVVEGVRRANASCEVVLDRAAAIDLAVRSAAPGDTVLLAGKGHEPYQIIGGVTRAFDDRIEAREALSRRRGGR